MTSLSSILLPISDQIAEFRLAASIVNYEECRTFGVDIRLK